MTGPEFRDLGSLIMRVTATVLRLQVLLRACLAVVRCSLDKRNVTACLFIHYLLSLMAVDSILR